MILKLLILYCFLLNCKGIKRYHPLYYKDYGTLIEPTGVVVSYDRVKYITVVIDFNTDITQKFQHVCDKNMSEGYEREILLNQIEVLYNTLPSTTHSIMSEYCQHHNSLCLDLEDKQIVRNKRQILAMIAALTGVAGLASSAYNWIKSNELTSHLDEVATSLTKMKGIIQDQHRQLYYLTDESNNIIRRTSMSFDYFHEFLTRYSCQAFSSMNAINIQNAGLQIQNEIKGIKDMINGNPDNYIIDGKMLSQIIKKSSSLIGTIYEKDRSMFYQVVRTNLIHVDKIKHRFAFLLEIPVIHTTMLSPLYKIYNCGWIKDQILHKLLFPKSFYLYSSEIDKSFHAVSLGNSHCWKRNEITVCDNSKHMMTEEMICLNSLLKGHVYDTCDVQLTKMMKESSVVKSLSGVLVCGNLDVKVISSAGTMFNYITQEKPSEHYSKFYPYVDFNQLIVGSTIIMSNSEKLPVVYKNDTQFLNPDFDYTWIHHYLSNKPWTSLKEIKHMNTESIWSMYNNEISHSTSNYVWIIIVILLLIILIIIYFIIKIKRDHSRMLNFIANQEIKRKLSKQSS